MASLKLPKVSFLSFLTVAIVILLFSCRGGDSIPDAPENGKDLLMVSYEITSSLPVQYTISARPAQFTDDEVYVDNNKLTKKNIPISQDEGFDAHLISSLSDFLVTELDFPVQGDKEINVKITTSFTLNGKSVGSLENTYTLSPNATLSTTIVNSLDSDGRYK